VAGTVAGAPEGEVLAAGAVVLAVPQPPPTVAAGSAGSGLGSMVGGPSGTVDAAGGGGLGGVVVLAVSRGEASRLAGAAGVRALTLTVALSLAPTGTGGRPTP
jgi:hypothetical protein